MFNSFFEDFKTSCSTSFPLYLFTKVFLAVVCFSRSWIREGLGTRLNAVPCNNLFDAPATRDTFDATFVQSFSRTKVCVIITLVFARKIILFLRQTNLGNFFPWKKIIISKIFHSIHKLNGIGNNLILPKSWICSAVCTCVLVKHSPNFLKAHRGVESTNWSLLWSFRQQIFLVKNLNKNFLLTKRFCECFDFLIFDAFC